MATALSGVAAAAGQHAARAEGTGQGHAAFGPRHFRLLEDKLQAPRPGLPVLQRRRVTDLVEAAVARRVTLVTGPPGAGKTIAIAQWAATRPAGRRPAWVSLDASDADPDQFWWYVTEALGRASALPGGRVMPSAPPAGLDPASIPRWMASLIRPAAEPVVLVLDDVHLLAGSAALAGLDELVRHEPAGLRLLLSGRSAPGLALARLRVGGDVSDIGAADLACTGEEASAYYAMLGKPLSPSERDHVLDRTEGWLAGLRLTALDADTSGGLAADYVQDEVLGPLPPEARTFLLRSSLTPVVPAGLARELTGESAAARLLAHLSRETGLVTPVSAGAAEYRYHPMLRTVLASALRRELPDEVAILQSRVARWHGARGEVVPAVRAAAEVGDWEFVVRLLRDAGPAVLLSDAGPAIEAALADVPESVVAGEPALSVAVAASRLWQGDADGALPHLEAAEAAWRDDAAGGGPRRHEQLWIAALRVLHRSTALPPVPGWLSAERSLAATAHSDPRGPGEHRALGVLWLALGFAALREFDTQSARAALLHAGSQLSAGGLLALRDRARSWEAVACALYGDLAAASRLAASVSDGPYGADGDLAPVLALAGAVVSLARDEPEPAGVLLDQADLSAMLPRPAGEPSIAVLTGLLRARQAMAEGNLAGARGLTRWLTDAAAGAVQAGYAGDARRDRPGSGSDAGAADPHRAGRYGASAVIAALDAEISLAAGERERAQDTLDALAGSASAGTGRPETVICRARLALADGDDKGALEQVAPLLTDRAGTCSVTDRLAALLVAVVARRRLGQPGEATELLSQALALAEPDDACGPFLTAGAAVRSALTVLITPSSRCASFAGRILERFDGRLLRPAAPHPAQLLTDSELAVLRFLPSHMTNQEIAEALFLSINTIKTHLSSVYRKLGVANRRQAIAQARRLELL